VQSQMEGFNTLQEKSEASIAEINSALKDSVTDNRDLDHLRQWSEQVNSNIQEMENLVGAVLHDVSFYNTAYIILKCCPTNVRLCASVILRLLHGMSLTYCH